MPFPGFSDFGTKCPYVGKARKGAFKGILVCPTRGSYNIHIKEKSCKINTLEVQAMFIFKILAAPFVLLLTVLVMVLSFLSSAASAVLNIISVILVIRHHRICGRVPHVPLRPARAGGLAHWKAGRAERISQRLYCKLTTSGQSVPKLRRLLRQPPFLLPWRR